MLVSIGCEERYRLPFRRQGPGGVIGFGLVKQKNRGPFLCLPVP